MQSLLKLGIFIPDFSFCIFILHDIQNSRDKALIHQMHMILTNPFFNAAKREYTLHDFLYGRTMFSGGESH